MFQRAVGFYQTGVRVCVENITRMTISECFNCVEHDLSEIVEHNTVLIRLFRAGDFTDHIQVILSVLVACMCQESPNTFRKGFWIGIEEFRMSGTNQKCS